MNLLEFKYNHFSSHFQVESHFQNSNVDRKQLLGRMSINDGTHLGGREDQPKGDVTPLVKWVTRGREVP